MRVDFKVVIPARYASTRLPGKPLLDLVGKPMVVRVAEQAVCAGASEIWVATDHAQVAAVVQEHGFNVLMTRSDHASGTDRLAEVVDLLAWEDETCVVNVQGDEPLIEPGLISQVVQQLAVSSADIATLAYPIDQFEDFANPNIVKLVLRENGDALYFSRAPIPYLRDAMTAQAEIKHMPAAGMALRHVGLYAYRAHFLRAYAGLAPAPQERVEALEQLRALWHDYRISVAIAQTMPQAGVDTLADAERVRCYLQSVLRRQCDE